MEHPASLPPTENAPPPAARTVDPRPLLRGTQCSLAQKPCLPQTAPGQGLSALGSRCWQAWHSCEGVLGPRPAVRDAFTSPSLRKDFDGGQRPFPASPASSLPPHTGVSPNKVLTAHFIFLSFGSSEDPGSHIWDFLLALFCFPTCNLPRDKWEDPCRFLTRRREESSRIPLVASHGLPWNPILRCPG